MSFRGGIYVLTVSVLFLGAGSCEPETGIPVIGTIGHGEQAQFAQAFIPAEEYPTRLTAATHAAQESTLQHLEKEEHSAFENEDQSPGWYLRTVSVGVGCNATIGIGPIQVGAFPEFRMIFTNSSLPYMP